MSERSYVGVNIQYPISKDIVSGKKNIETRTYSIPESYLGCEMLLIETPGKSGDFKSRIIAIIKFTDCFLYKNKKQFYADVHNHLVTPESPWAWKDKSKWGWRVEVVKKIIPPIEVTRRKGIVFTKGLKIEN